VAQVPQDQELVIFFQNATHLDLLSNPPPCRTETNKQDKRNEWKASTSLLFVSLPSETRTNEKKKSNERIDVDIPQKQREAVLAIVSPTHLYLSSVFNLYPFHDHNNLPHPSIAIIKKKSSTRSCYHFSSSLAASWLYCLLQALARAQGTPNFIKSGSGFVQLEPSFLSQRKIHRSF